MVSRLPGLTGGSASHLPATVAIAAPAAIARLLLLRR
jgi:hypothetical protein